MTYIPEVPLWCWVLEGENLMFFSQPTHAYLCEPPHLAPDGRFLALGASETRWLDALPACVARCQHQTQFFMDDTPVDSDTPARLTPPIQCGVVAGVDALGRYLCHVHLGAYWTCHHCHAPLAAGMGGFCSPACCADYEVRCSEE